jgi:AcrR family transcriptional regulator
MRASAVRVPTDLSAPERILDVAEALGQTRGFNGFSYADIAVQLGVTKASLHYHFPSKSDLGRALVALSRSFRGRARQDRPHHQDAAGKTATLRRVVRFRPAQ